MLVNNNLHKLLTSATTGNSAYHVSGNTIHSYLSIASYQNDFCNDEAAISTKALQDRWFSIEYLIVEECSMLGLILLNKISNKLMLETKYTVVCVKMFP